MQATNSEPSVMAQGTALLQAMLSGATLGSILGQTEKAQEAMYYLGYTLYGQGKYADAMRAFGFLMVHDHLDRRYHTGFAACLQMQKRHRDAIKYYGVASLMDLTDPEPVIHTAECHLALGEVPQARTSLEYALAQARGCARHNAHIDRIETMLAFIASGSSPQATSAPAGAAVPS